MSSRLVGYCQKASRVPEQLPVVRVLIHREEGQFLSVEDLKKRGKAGSAVVDMLRAHGALDGLTETNQISMF